MASTVQYFQNIESNTLPSAPQGAIYSIESNTFGSYRNTIFAIMQALNKYQTSEERKMNALRSANIRLQNVKFIERRKVSRSDHIIARAKINHDDLTAIDQAAEMIGVTRNEFVLSGAVSLAKSYLEQRAVQ